MNVDLSVDDSVSGELSLVNSSILGDSRVCVTFQLHHTFCHLALFCIKLSQSMSSVI